MGNTLELQQTRVAERNEVLSQVIQKIDQCIEIEKYEDEYCRGVRKGLRMIRKIVEEMKQMEG